MPLPYKFRSSFCISLPHLTHGFDSNRSNSQATEMAVSVMGPIDWRWSRYKECSAMTGVADSLLWPFREGRCGQWSQHRAACSANFGLMASNAGYLSLLCPSPASSFFSVYPPTIYSAQIFLVTFWGQAGFFCFTHQHIGLADCLLLLFSLTLSWCTGVDHIVSASS